MRPLSSTYHQFKRCGLGGFYCSFGIATDDGVLIGTYLDQSMAKKIKQKYWRNKSCSSRSWFKRIKPAIMTTATTIIALLPRFDFNRKRC